MIKLQNSQISQILPEYFSEQASVQALSFAINRAVERLVEYCRNISVFAVIDTVPDYILDMLAIELNTQYYDSSLPIQAKRELIKNTMVWYMRAGTPKAVEELVSIVFGKGEVHEWFQYDGDPYMFRIVTSADATYESIEEFEKLIKRVKNVRSHIDEVIFAREHEIKLFFSATNIVKIAVSTGWKE